MRKGEIEGRIDAQFYGENLDVKDSVKIGSFIKVKGGKRIPKGLSYATEETDFWYLRVDDIDAFGNIKFQNLKYISREIYETLKNYELKPDEVVISIAGTIGKITLLENAPEKKIILTENCAKLQIKNNNLLPKYLAFILSLPFAQKQMSLSYIQTTIPKLGLERIYNLKIPPVPPLEVQRQIIEKFEAAYRVKLEKETKAWRLLTSIDAYLLDRLGIRPPAAQEAKKTFFYRNLSEVTGSRFDANSYHAERLSAVESVKNGNYSFNKLKFLADFPKTIVSETALPYVGMENIESNTGNFIQTSEKESFGSAILFDKNQILFPKLRPYLNKVYFAEFDGVCSTEFHILDSRSDDLTNEFLASFLRNEIIVAQTKHLMSGNTLPRLQTEDIENLLIPLPPVDVQEEIAAHVQAIRTRAKELETEARAEIERAKTDIEAMILGEVNADA